MNNKVLVTGGAGMIGTNITSRLVKYGYDVSVVDNLWRGKISNLEGIIDFNNFYFRDLTKQNAALDLCSRSDCVIHLADLVAGIDYVFNNQLEIFHRNLLINTYIADAVMRGNVEKYIYVGTACSFPAEIQKDVNGPPLLEEQQYPANPESAYGWSKLMGEYEATLLEQKGINVAILSLHNVYGTPCDYSEESGQVIPSLIRKAIRYPYEDFVVWGSGNQGRAFVHVDDVSSAIISALEFGFGQGVIQIGPSVCTTIKEIVDSIISISGKDIIVKYDKTKREGDIGRCADYSKALRILGWRPRVSIDDGISKLYDWIKNEINKIQ